MAVAACPPAPQRILVVAPTLDSTRATLRLVAGSGRCFRVLAGPWPARVGRNGLSAHHREGDGTTPLGGYRIGPVVYGVAPDPGTRLRYRRLRCGDWWDEDPRSPTYNLFVHVRCGRAPPFRGGSEALWRERRAYAHFAVVEYNTARVPGRGSAIFLHADTGSATNGCVSVALPHLERLLRLLRPGARIVVSTQQRSTAAVRAVARPRFVRNLPTGETGWFASPGLADLDGDGKLEIVAPFSSTFVFSASGRRLAKATATKGRVYAPEVVADLDGDRRPEIVVGGNDGTVAAYDYRGGALRLVPGWPASTCSGGQCPETRGLAAADLDGDGRVEVVATTTNTSKSGSQIFVFEPDGKVRPGWPRDRGYGAYGENVGVGDLDDDPQLEIVATFDDHQIDVLDPDGRSLLASPWFTSPDSRSLGRRLAWGDFVRWLDPDVEEAHYHRHAGAWPDVRKTPWLQWTASPPTVADLDRDGRNEVIGIPNVERGEPYVTRAYAFVVLDGAEGGGARSARRHPGFERPPLSGKPAFRPQGDWYPPSGIPAPTVVDLTGDGRPEVVAAVPDGRVYAISPTGRKLWRFDYARGAPKTFASEVVAADLNRDGRPELVFGVYGPKVGAGRLVVLSAAGKLLYDVRLPHQRLDGNGVGVAAAPSIADLDGDGALEVALTTIDHGLDVFRVPGSGTNLLPWPTGRGNLLRNGVGPATAR